MAPPNPARLCFLIFLAVGFASSAQAQTSVFHSDTLEAYSAVEDTIPGDQYTVRESDDYAVALSQRGSTIKSFTHKSISPNTSPREQVARRLSWSQFSFRDAVEVEVRNLRGSIRSVQLVPSRLAIPIERVGNDRFRFKLTEPAKVGLIVNGDELNPLFIHASPMPSREPARTDPGIIVIPPGRHGGAVVSGYSQARTLYFLPGLHVLDAPLTVGPRQRVYLSTGSYVLGQIAGRNGNFDGLEITGRGVLSGQHHGPLGFDVGTMIHLMGGLAFRPRDGAAPYQVEISGITLADQPSFAIRGVTVTYVHVAGINILAGWHFRTDGIVVGDHALIEDTFINVNDDSAKIFSSFSEWKRLTIWQGTNGAPFQFSWNTDHEIREVSVHDVDIVRVGHFRDGENHAVFDSVHAGKGNLHDIRFENITVEGPVWRLFRIGTFYTHSAVAKSGEAGGIGDITFTNLTVAKSPSQPSEFLLCQNAGASGRCPNTFLGPIRFQNLRIAGRLIRSLSELAPRIAERDRALISFNVGN